MSNLWAIFEILKEDKNHAKCTLCGQSKEYIERRHGEPFKFLYLPKMGLLGSQAVLEKKIQF
jgi:hypothetical protein